MNDTEPLELAHFGAALEFATREEQADYLGSKCGNDPALRARVEALLAAHYQAGEFLHGSQSARAIVDALQTERPGSVIGPFKLREQIGEGGFGVVYMAEQQQPVRRKVALKVLKPGMDTRQVVARFEAERQALAILDHPNIAKVHDGGATPSGRPYFVMELVRGVPITIYCDDNRLTLRARLELFRQVCAAVQHAHQKGIIHRDLKPSNVMVVSHDGTPVVKIIDFGVAKALGQELTDKSLCTGFAQLIGTPLYMSPEQAGHSGLDIDTRSDIYSLGVLLFELLTGTTPFDRERFKQAPYDEICRIIREEEPPKPSTRLSDSTETLPLISAQRQMEPAKLRRQVRGELDWIVMKALEKNRNRRYETANGFARDIERYLADEPVQACPPSSYYRFRKFAWRNKSGLAVAASILFAIVLLGGGAGWFVRDRSARHAETAARLESVLHDSARLRSQKNWAEARSAALRADALLNGSADYPDMRQKVDDLVKDLDMVDRLERVREDQTKETDDFWVHGNAYAAFETAFRDYGIDVLRLDATEAAKCVKASAIAEQLVMALDDWVWVSGLNTERREPMRTVVCLADPDPWRVRFRDRSVQRNRAALEELAGSPEMADQSPNTIAFLGRALGQAKSPEKAVEVLTTAQKRHPDHFWLNLYLGSILRWNVSPPRHLEAASYHRAALALRPKAARVHLEMGGCMLTPALADEAIAHFRRALELQPDYAHPHASIGNALAMKRHWCEAIESYEECLRLATSPVLRATVYYDLGKAHRASNERDKAIASWQKAIEIDPKRPRPYTDLGKALEANGKLDDALVAFRQALKMEPKSAWAHLNVGRVLGRQGLWDQAEAFNRKAVALSPKFATAYNDLGWALLRQSRFDEAITVLGQALALDSKYVHARIHLGEALFRQEKLGDAIAIWQEAALLDSKSVTPRTWLAWALTTAADPMLRDPSLAVKYAREATELAPKVANHWSNYGVALLRAGECKDAVETLEKADRMWKGGDNHHRFFLAMAYWRIGATGKALQTYEKAVQWMDKNEPNNEELRRFQAEAAKLLETKKQ